MENGGVKTRKAHRKSRTGCLPCKARHVKCDEQKPNCAACVKQAVTCEYRPSLSREVTTGSPAPGAISTPLSIGINRDVSREVSLNVPQLRLLHHYTTITAKTLAHDTASEAVFTSHLVQVAFTNEYLLHSILALAALHLTRLEDASQPAHAEYSVLADLHHEAALTIFRDTVTDIDQSNWKAVLMFAGATFPYSCTASISAGYDLEQAFDNFLSNMALTRRVRPMVMGFYQEMQASELGHMIPDDVKGADWTTKEAPADTELVQLRRFAEVVHQIYAPDIVDAYGYAVHILELTFAVAAQSSTPPSDALLKIWMHFVSDRFVELLSERQPGSMIILAHYSVLLRRSEQYWFLEGVAEQLLNIAIAKVPTEWQSWLMWPREQIRGGPFTLT